MSRMGFLICICCLAGCGGGASPVPLEDYCDRYTDMACKTAEKCGCLEGIPSGACRQVLLPDCEEEVTDPVEAGLMDYHPAEAGACIDALRKIAVDCSTDGDHYPPACERTLTGRLTESQICTDGDHCRPGLECYDDSCTDMPANGEPCLGGYDCAEDHFCDAEGTCRAYLTNGAPCTDADVCDDDLYCSELHGTCRPYPGRGGDCADSHGTCAEEHYCDPDLVCQAQQPGGAPCAESEECLSYECQAGTCSDEEPDDICDDW